MRSQKIYIIAEAGVNHNGSLKLAKQLVDVAVQAKADAIKFQTFKAENLVSGQAPKAEYQKQATGTTETQLDMLKKLELTEVVHDELAVYCKERGIDFLSTPFDIESLKLLVEKFDLPYIKIPSGEITNAPFLLNIAQTAKKVILSTGMSTLGEIESALGVLAFGYLKDDKQPCISTFQNAYVSDEGQRVLRDNVMLLHCTTEYPVPSSEVNLNVIDTLRQAFGLPVGYSDHTAGLAVPIAAVAKGAVLIEKHFTLDKNLPGPDHKASLEPTELAKMIQAIREVELALGHSQKYPTASEYRNIHIARKSLVARKDIAEGEMFTAENVTAKRPGSGISPLYYWSYLQKKARREYKLDELIDE